MKEPQELLQAMQQMLQALNWHAYLHFRRAYLKEGGETSQVRRQLSSLPDEIQLSYGRYFNSNQELAKRIKSQLKKEKARIIVAKKAERKAARQKKLDKLPDFSVLIVQSYYVKTYPICPPNPGATTPWVGEFVFSVFSLINKTPKVTKTKDSPRSQQNKKHDSSFAQFGKIW